MLTSETKRRIDSCRDILVGKLPLPTDQVELITLALIYKFMDDLDEESVEMGGKRSFFTQHLEPYRWRNLLPQTVSAEQRMALFARGIELLGGADMEVEVKEKGETKKVRIIPAAHLPGLFRDVFRNAFLKFRDGRVLALLLAEVNGFVYSHSEELGNAFEYLLMSAGVQADNGQFRTPRHIIDFMVECLQPQPGERVLDPACGTAGFLVAAFTYILRTHTSPESSIQGDKLTHTQREAVYSSFTGYDITDAMVKLSKVNLFLHGFPDPTIHIYDTLTNDARWNEKADLILANPPFMTPKGGIAPHTRFRVAAKKSEVLFTDYIAEHLSSEGRGGVIVPNGIVATPQNAYVKLRRFLVEDCLVAVVSLPSGVFKPYSGVKTSILFFDKQLARKTKEVLFLKITADGFDLGDQRREIEANDLPEAERVVKAWFTGKLNDELRMTVGKGIVWRAIEKKTLLESRAVSLQAEVFVGADVASTEVQMVTFRDLCVRMQYGLSVPLNTEGKGVKCFRMNELPIGRAADSGEMKCADISNADGEKYRLQRGDLLFNRTNSIEHVGRTGIFDLPGDYVFASYLIRLEINRELAAPAYVNALMNSFRFQKGVKSLASRAVGQANISASSLADYEIPLPPLEEQRRIVAEIEDYQKVLDGARQILAGYRPQVDLDSECESEAFEAICSTITPPKKILATDFGVEGRYPIIDQSQDAIAGYTNDETALIDATIGLVIFGDHTCAVKYVQEPFAQGADGIKIIQTKTGLLPKFLFYYLTSHPIEQEGYKRHYSKLKTLEIPVPDLEEQRRIVSELDAEAAQMEAVRSLIPRFEGKIQRVLDRVWGTSVA